jgi:hypothetical protein
MVASIRCCGVAELILIVKEPIDIVSSGENEGV